MVHVERDGGGQLTERVVGELGHVDDGVDALEIVSGDLAEILLEGLGRVVDTVVEPTRLVVAGVDAEHLVPVAHQHTGEEATEVALGSRDEDVHDSVAFRTEVR